MTSSAIKSSTNPSDEGGFLPPPGPPPLLTTEQLIHLAEQGWLILPKPTPTSPLNNTLSTLKKSLDALIVKLPQFFSESSDFKTSSYLPRQGTEFGYYCIPEEKEYLTLRCHVHPASELEERAAEVWKYAGKLLERILREMAAGLALRPEVWDDLVNGTLRIPDKWEEVSSGTLLRMFRYEAGKGFSGVHTDLGLLTVCFGDQGGLQLLDRQRVEQGGDERWTDVQPGDIVLLVGQTAKALTEGTIRAGVHRVLASEHERHSVVFALRHSWRNQIDLKRFGGHGSVESRKLWEALNIGVMSVNAQKEVRDKQWAELNRLRAKTDEGGQG